MSFRSTSCCSLTLDGVRTIFRFVHPNIHRLEKGTETALLQKKHGVLKALGKNINMHTNTSAVRSWENRSHGCHNSTLLIVCKTAKDPLLSSTNTWSKHETSLGRKKKKKKTQDAGCICNYNTHKWTGTSGLGEESVKVRSAIWNMKFHFSGMATQPWTEPWDKPWQNRNYHKDGFKTKDIFQCEPENKFLLKH